MKKMKISDLIVRIEAPTVIYRVTSKIADGVFRCLPYRRSGKEVVIIKTKTHWIGDGSVWREWK